MLCCKFFGQKLLLFFFFVMWLQHERTVGGQSVRLSTLGVSSVDRRLLHAAELRLTSVRRHGRGRGRGQDVGVRP